MTTTEQQIADAEYWAKAGLATGRNDACQRCPKKYGEPSPECPNRREHAQEERERRHDST